LLFKKYTYKYYAAAIHLTVILLLSSCQFSPVYKSANLGLKLCSIKVNDERSSAELYEIVFKNELKSILCTTNMSSPLYAIKWNITKSYRELIKSESNTAKRYEETLLINFSIYNIENNALVYNDTVSSKGAYTILEDEIISTLASNKAIESQIAISAARLTLDKIYLFMLKNENSKL